MLRKLSIRDIRKTFFIKNFFLFLIPALLSIAIIGMLSYWFTYSDVKQHVEENNNALLDNAMNRMESIIKEIEDININLSSNPFIKIRLKRILSNIPLVLAADDHTAFRTIADMIFVSANSNKYIHSIYIYIESPNEMYLESREKQIHALSDSKDRSWHDSYLRNKEDPAASWVERRSIHTEFRDISLLTLYNKTYSTLSGLREPDGVLVLNIYADSINQLLDSLINVPEQTLLVVDDQNRLIFNSNHAVALPDDIAPIATSASHTYRLNNESYVVTSQHFERYNWRFISLVPRNTLYKIPNRIVVSTMLGFILSIAASAMFALYTTKRAYNNFSSLLTIIELTQKGESVADIHPPKSSNEYNYIVHNLLKTFIEHDYLTVQKKYRMQALELQAMQAQVNPHFLLNTMETIYWRSMNSAGRPGKSTAIIEDISSILQYSLYNPMELVCLFEEVDIAKSYMNIQKVRHKNRFEEQWDVDPMLVEYKINKLILQSILENAIYHGYRDDQHVLKIRIRISRHESGLRLSIIDNGKGIPTDKLAEIRQSLHRTSTDFSRHIGLYNTHRRILLTHGEPYGLKIFSVRNIGTLVRIDLPLIG